MSDRYALEIDRPARRALSQELPPKVAMAAWELINGALRDEPQRIGKRLRAPLAGYWVARRSTYRIRYRIDDDSRTIIVMDIQHRADAYRP
ncbi:type II toxin-antitoxin system RelE family toxin [Actinopolymorpha alba]|uniref:type II toxin-antitoxin system RelE family toxin n=1 Tax=Actinopolymorpha alba TaxID=533267 RepID=UPI0004764949|nr:type II toxin-antitoxin system RelE/ParE family toxin [Actinopolymorpha alba]